MSADPLGLVRLRPLMAMTEGRDEVLVAVLDGPVASTHPELARARIRDLPGSSSSTCGDTSSPACRHGTFVAGMLSSARDSTVPGICPGCTLLVRPIFPERRQDGDELTGATPSQLAEGITACIEAGARVVNVSGAVAGSAIREQVELSDVLSDASRSGVLVIAAAGNQGGVGRSAITGHPWVVAAVAYGHDGRPLPHANLGRSIGRHGLGAPGQAVTSLNPTGGTATMSGSSVAAPFVTGAAALLLSLVPTVTGHEIQRALVHHQGRRTTITPPLLDAWGAYEALVRHHLGRREHGEERAREPGRARVIQTPGAPSPVSRR